MHKDIYTLGTIPGEAKNHAIFENGILIAKVVGGGYPLGEGWSESSEKRARLITAVLNSHIKPGMTRLA